MANTSNDIKRDDSDFYKVTSPFYIELKIKGIQVIPDNIVSLKLVEMVDEIIPRLELTIKDDGLFFDKFPIEDNDVIDLKCSLNKETDPLLGSFHIQGHTVINSVYGQITSSLVKIVALMKNTNVFSPIYTRSFGNIKSSELVKKLSDEFGLTSDIRINSNDTMKWLQIDQNNNDFLYSVMDKSYYLDDDCILCFGQLNYGIVYTTLNTEIKKEVIYETVYDNSETVNDASEIYGTKSVNQNDKTKKTIIYFNDYQYHDPSPIVNKINSNALSVVYSDGGDKKELVQKNDSKPLTSNSFKSKVDIGKLSEHINRRNISSSVHNNYYKAMIQNMKIKNEYFTTHLALDVKTRSDYKLMQKVNVSLPSQANDRLNYVHSGHYVIGGIVHTLGSNSILSTRLYLYRNGMNADLSSIETYETKLS